MCELKQNSNFWIQYIHKRDNYRRSSIAVSLLIENGIPVQIAIIHIIILVISVLTYFDILLLFE